MRAMTCLINSAATWALEFARRAPQPLFAAPAFFFILGCKELPDAPGASYISLSDVIITPPEALLRRAKSQPMRPGTRALVLVIALDGDGDLYADAIVPPARYLLYVYVPSHLGAVVVERRIVTPAQPDGIFRIDSDTALPFDDRHRLRLGALPPTQPHHDPVPPNKQERLH